MAIMSRFEREEVGSTPASPANFIYVIKGCNFREIVTIDHMLRK